ncbi:MAG: hypothetical protein AMXMBFR19_02000, partial [Chthonomonadaceae bacterium]
ECDFTSKGRARRTRKTPPAPKEGSPKSGSARLKCRRSRSCGCSPSGASSARC